MGVFNRLGYNFDSTKFGSGEPFTEGQAKLLDSASSLKTWQADDLINVAATGYFQNPHTANLATLSTLATSIMVYANTSNTNIIFSDSTTANVSNLLFAAANTLYNEIPNFTEHTNRMSGVTSTSNGNVLPDYQIAMAVGRQVLAITNQIDGMQNNSPLLGNFTSLAIGPDIVNNITKLNNDLNGLISPAAYTQRLLNYKFLSGGNHYTLAVQSNGTLWSWGYNNNGQLGLSDTNTRYSPIQVGSLSTWTQVSAGNYNTLATQSDGTLWAWGINDNGQLGLSNRTNRSSPVQVGSLSVWKQIFAGSGYSFAIQSDGTLWSWGFGGNGQLGLSNLSSRSSPTQVGSLSTWTQVSINVYGDHTLALQSNGSLWAWGFNFYGQLGLNTTTTYSSPVQVGSLSAWTKIASGGTFSSSIQSDGTLWSWGNNSWGQLGLNTSTNYFSPIQVGNLLWKEISCGYLYTLAIQSNGTLWAWGYNDWGQLGLSDQTNRSSPVQIGSASNWTKISTGTRHSLAIQSNSSLWAWGFNAFGQLGLSNSSSVSSPVQVTTSGYYDWNKILTLNITSSDSMNTFILDVQTAYNLLSQRRQGDTNFYLNSLALVNDYNKVSQFSTVGVNSNYLINTLNIGTDKLKTNLQSNTVIPTVVNSGATTTTSSATTTSSTTSSGLTPTGVAAGSYSTANITVDTYGRVTSANSGSSFPPGGIIMWSGSVATIPSGWYLCDGANGTPDLRNRFIIGAGSTYSPAATGGSADAVTVSHTHTITDPTHSHLETYFDANGGGYGLISGPNNYNATKQTGSSSTGISVNTAGVSGTNANLPPYYALAFIMKA